MGVRGPQHRDVLPGVVEPDDALRHRPQAAPAFQAFQLHAGFDEERHDGVQVVDNGQDVVHRLNRHAGLLGAVRPRRPQLP
ncbi:hypothetical protein [Streptomyces lydicus]|uniref:hypothetical protein n=1 Tax=Streptomyces lydicus TaxID=47763 RepID=UPI0037B0FD09